MYTCIAEPAKGLNHHRLWGVPLAQEGVTRVLDNAVWDENHHWREVEGLTDSWYSK